MNLNRQEKERRKRKGRIQEKDEEGRKERKKNEWGGVAYRNRREKK